MLFISSHGLYTGVAFTFIVIYLRGLPCCTSRSAVFVILTGLHLGIRKRVLYTMTSIG